MLSVTLLLILPVLLNNKVLGLLWILVLHIYEYTTYDMIMILNVDYQILVNEAAVE